MRARRVAPLAVGVLALAGCGHRAAPPRPAPSAPATIAVTSTAFTPGGPIPTRYSCKGANTSPPLACSGVPAQAGALALVVDDPDAPGGTYRHWIVVDIPPRVTSVAEGGSPAGGHPLPNSNGNAGYDGPCPPSGTHHYRFTLYALRRPLGLPAGATTDQALAAIDAGSSARGQLVGTFSH